MRSKILTATLLFVVAVIVAGCNRDRDSITGDYSYKLSGEVELTDADGAVTYHLVHRNGQMNILKDRVQKSKYVVTMNEATGGCYTMTAELHGDSLVIEPHSFNTNILSSNGFPNIGDNENTSIVYRITATGNGVHNSNMLILNETWKGQQSGNTLSTLNGPEMIIIAEKN